MIHRARTIAAGMLAAAAVVSYGAAWWAESQRAPGGIRAPGALPGDYTVVRP